MSSFDLRDITRDSTGPAVVKRLLFAVEHSVSQSQQRVLMSAVFDEIAKLIVQSKHVHLLLNEALKVWQSKLGGEVDPLIVQSISQTIGQPIQQWLQTEEKGYSDMQRQCDHNLSVQKREGEREAIYSAIYQSITQFYNWCDYDSTLQRAFEAKEWANLPHEIIAINLAIIKSAFMMNTVGHVKMHALRIKSLMDQSTKSTSQSSHSATNLTDAELSVITDACLGMVALCSGQYAVAAQSFANVDMKQIGSMRDCFTPGDILIYSAFASLGCLSRKELREQALPVIKQSVDQSSTNKQLVSYQATWRAAVDNFLASNYAQVYQSITQAGSYLRFDRILAGHTDRLISLIKKRSLIEQFQPYINLSMSDLSTSLGLSKDDLSSLIHQSINQGDLHARIDTVNELLVKTSSTVSQSVNQSKTIELGAKGIRDIRTALLRMDCQEQNISISNPKGGQRGRS